MKKFSLKLFILIGILFVSMTAFAVNKVLVFTSYTHPAGQAMGQTITNFYQNFILPKMPSDPSTVSSIDEQFKIFYTDSTNYNFIYAECEKAGFPNSGKWKISITYRNGSNADPNNLPVELLSGYAYPGDSINWNYTETGGNTGSVNIANDNASGHGSSWSYTDSISINWTGGHPNSFIEPVWDFGIDSTKIGGVFSGKNCLGDMPAQDVHNSGTHYGHLDLLAFVTLADTSQVSAIMLPVSPAVTNVNPTSCNISLTTGTYGPWTYNTMSWYAGG